MQNNTLGGMIAAMPLGMRIVQSDYVCYTCAEMETIPPELPVLLCSKHYEELNLALTPKVVIKLIRILRTLANQPSAPESE